MKTGVLLLHVHKGQIMQSDPVLANHSHSSAADVVPVFMSDTSTCLRKAAMVMALTTMVGAVRANRNMVKALSCSLSPAYMDTVLRDQPHPHKAVSPACRASKVRQTETPHKQ